MLQYLAQVEEVGKQRLGALLHVVVPLLPGGLCKMQEISKGRFFNRTHTVVNPMSYTIPYITILYGF